jgi:hypothetical protein
VQTHPGEVPSVSIKAFEILRIEIKEGPFKAGEADALQINLQSNMREHTNDQWNDEPCRPVLKKFPQGSRPKSIECAFPRNDEDQRHHPTDKKNGPNLHGLMADGIFYMPAIHVKEPTAMENEDGQDDQDAEPIEIVTTDGSGRDHVAPNGFRKRGGTTAA